MRFVLLNEGKINKIIMLILSRKERLVYALLQYSIHGDKVKMQILNRMFGTTIDSLPDEAEFDSIMTEYARDIETMIMETDKLDTLLNENVQTIKKEGRLNGTNLYNQ